MGPPKSNPLRGPASLLAHLLVSTPLRCSASSLAHRSVSGSDTNCNSQSPPLVDTVRFGLSLSSFPSRFLKRVCWGEVSTPLRVFRSPLQPTWDLTIFYAKEYIWFLKRVCWGEVSTPLRVFRSPPQPTWDLTIFYAKEYIKDIAIMFIETTLTQKDWRKNQTGGIRNMLLYLFAYALSPNVGKCANPQPSAVIKNH